MKDHATPAGFEPALPKKTDIRQRLQGVLLCAHRLEGRVEQFSVNCSNWAFSGCSLGRWGEVELFKSVALTTRPQCLGS